jgi:beta-galactosidase
MIENTKRLHLSMNRDWKFKSDIHMAGQPETLPNPYDVADKDVYNCTKAGGKQGVPQSDYDTRSWGDVDLPHDFLIKETFDEKLPSAWGYKPRGTAWYRKSFTMSEEYTEKRFVLHFEGVLTNCEVFFNGSRLFRQFSGYTPFYVDLTDYMFFGDKPNVLAVYVDATAFEGWWYEGGGIYRPVWLDITEKTCFTEEPHITVTKIRNSEWNIAVAGKITGINTGNNTHFEVRKTIYDPYDSPVLTFTTDSTVIRDPEIWDINNPVLYTFKTELIINGQTIDEYICEFGFRTIELTPDKGFFLNGRSVKLYGMCNHQDLAGVGAAMTDSLWIYKVSRLKEMGANAYRSAHGCAPDGLVRACDRLGMLLMDENRNFDSTEEAITDLKAMVNRDYNHPSVVFYSICNEEPWQSNVQGKNIAVRLQEEIKAIDTTRFITGAMNSGVIDGNGFAKVLDCVGINYQPFTYDKYHAENPTIPIVAAETTSYTASRGETVTDTKKCIYSGFDECQNGWGTNVRSTWRDISSRDFVAGGFVWTGFDYLGEPTPAPFPAVSSYFGMMDTCGFPKGGYYLSKAFFAENANHKPYVRFFPDYDGVPGETVKFMSAVNSEQAELFINGVSKGLQTVDKYTQMYWEFPFEPGEARLVGYAASGDIIGEFTQRSPGAFNEIKLNPFFDSFDHKTELIPVILTAVDENGCYCPNANPTANLCVEGGYIAGTGNGDPCCHEDFCGNSRTLFHGKALVIIGADKDSVFVKLSVTATGTSTSTTTISIPCKPRRLPFVPTAFEIFVGGWRMSEVCDNRPDETVKREHNDNNSMTIVFPENGIVPETVNIIGKYVLFNTTVNIPQILNGKPPLLVFHKIWGDHDIYLNRKLVRTFETRWAAEQTITPDVFGETDITIICKSTNKYGTGLASSVIIR